MPCTDSAPGGTAARRPALRPALRSSGLRAAPTLAALLALCGPGPAQAVATFSAQGADAAAITSTVNDLRAALGSNNGVGACVAPCVPGQGRREINWDAVPDAAASPAALPGNFFNLALGSAAGRIRGAQFSSSGTMEVSAVAGNPAGTAPLFGNHQADNADDYAAFSPGRIFGLVGSNQLDMVFSLPGQPGSSALVRGFGAVFTDVELAGGTRLDYYGAGGALLLSLDLPAFPFVGGDSGKSFSFAGAVFDSPVVQRVHITSGGYDLNLQLFGANDAVAMDDFIYGEPAAAVPEPASVALWLAGVLGLLAARRQPARL